eukprot:127010_1
MACSTSPNNMETVHFVTFLRANYQHISDILMNESPQNTLHTPDGDDFQLNFPLQPLEHITSNPLERCDSNASCTSQEGNHDNATSVPFGRGYVNNGFIDYTLLNQTLDDIHIGVPSFIPPPLKQHHDNNHENMSNDDNTNHKRQKASSSAWEMSELLHDDLLCRFFNRYVQEQLKNASSQVIDEILKINLLSTNSTKLQTMMNIHSQRTRNIARNIVRQQQITNAVMIQLLQSDTKQQQLFQNILIEVIVKVINEKIPFPSDVLSLCFEFIRNDKQSSSILGSKLWKAIKKASQSIIHNGTDTDWVWFNSFLASSTIWFLRTNSTDDINNFTCYLYHELFKIFAARDHDLATMMTHTLERRKQLNIADWNKLQNWKLSKTHCIQLQQIQNVCTVSTDPDRTQALLRQDNIERGIQSGVYCKNYNHYLSDLLLLANEVDEEFQNSVQKIFDIDKDSNIGKLYDIIKGTSNKNNTFMDKLCAKICDNDDDDLNTLQTYLQHEEYDTDALIVCDGLLVGSAIANNDYLINYVQRYVTNKTQIKYIGASIKSVERIQTKTENELSEQKYPQIACISDFNRCQLICNDIETLLFSAELFAKQVTNHKGGNIIGIVDCWNLWKDYDPFKMHWSDIRFYVIIRGKTNNIIGEVMFCLNEMVNGEYGQTQHRIFELVRD